MQARLFAQGALPEALLISPSSSMSAAPQNQKSLHCRVNTWSSHAGILCGIKFRNEDSIEMRVIAGRKTTSRGQDSNFFLPGSRSCYEDFPVIFSIYISILKNSHAMQQRFLQLQIFIPLIKNTSLLGKIFANS